MPGSIIKVFLETFAEEPQGRRRRREEENGVTLVGHGPGAAATRHSRISGLHRQIQGHPDATVAKRKHATFPISVTTDVLVL